MSIGQKLEKCLRLIYVYETILNIILSKKRSFKSFKMNESLYRSLINSFPDSIVIIDLKGNIIDVSDSALKIYGSEKKEDITGQNILKFIANEHQETTKKNFKKLLEEGFLDKFEFNILKKDGSVSIGESSSVLVKNNEGKPQFILSILRNITERKITRENLTESKNMFQLVIDNIPQHIFWKDINSVYLGCNKNFARAAGVMDPSKIIGKKDFELAWEKSEAETFYEIDRLVMESDKPEYHIIESQLQADGKKSWVDKNKIPLHDNNGNVVGILGTYGDITERILSERALKDSEKKYRESYNRANFFKDLFSHDISNILQSIESAIELISLFTTKKNEDKSEELKEVINIIMEQVNRGALLVNNIQRLSQIEESSNPLYPTEANKVLKDSLKFIHGSFQSRNLHIQIDSLNNNIYVQANELLLDAFENILINAVKYNNNPIVEILIKISKVQENGKSCFRFQFIDNGFGIIDIRKEKIFQRAYNKGQNISGLGLGLSLVKKIIESYEGKIWVEDKIEGEPKKGSKFIILIPEA